MLKKSLVYVLGALMFILWAGQPVQSQSLPAIPLKKANLRRPVAGTAGEKVGLYRQDRAGRHPF